MMDSTILKIIHNRLEGETLLLLLITATGNVLIDCDDKTLVILLEELRPLRLVSNRSVTAIAEDVLDGSQAPLNC